MIIREVMPLDFSWAFDEGADVAVEEHQNELGISCHVLTYSRDIARMVAEELGWDFRGLNKMRPYCMSSQVPIRETVAALETLTSSLEARRGWKYAVVGTFAQRMDEEPVRTGFT